MRFYFRTGPPPYQTHFNLPAPFKTMPVAALQAHNWPVYPDQYRNALVNPGETSMNKDVFFLPLPAVRHPYAGAIYAVDAVRNAQAQYRAFAQIATDKYLGGHSLTPPEAQAVLALQATRAEDEIAWNAIKMRQCPPPGGGARQVSFHPRAQPPFAVLALMQRVARGDIINPAMLVSTPGMRAEAAASAMANAVYEASGTRVLPSIQQPGQQMANNVTQMRVAPTARVPAAALATFSTPARATTFPIPGLTTQGRLGRPYVQPAQYAGHAAGSNPVQNSVRVVAGQRAFVQPAQLAPARQAYVAPQTARKVAAVQSLLNIRMSKGR